MVRDNDAVGGDVEVGLRTVDAQFNGGPEGLHRVLGGSVRGVVAAVGNHLGQVLERRGVVREGQLDQSERVEDFAPLEHHAVGPRDESAGNGDADRSGAHRAVADIGAVLVARGFETHDVAALESRAEDLVDRTGLHVGRGEEEEIRDLDGAALRLAVLDLVPEHRHRAVRQRSVVDARQDDVSLPGGLAVGGCRVAADAEPAGAGAGQRQVARGVDLVLQLAVDIDAGLLGLLVVDADQMVVSAAYGRDVALGPSVGASDMGQEGEAVALRGGGDEESRAARLHRAEGLDLLRTVALGVEHDERLQRMSVGECILERRVGRIVYLIITRRHVGAGGLVEVGDVPVIALAVVGHQRRSGDIFHLVVHRREVRGRPVVVELHVEQVGCQAVLRHGNLLLEGRVILRRDRDGSLQLGRTLVHRSREDEFVLLARLLREPRAAARNGVFPPGGVRLDGQLDIAALDGQRGNLGGRDGQIGGAARLDDGHGVDELLLEVEIDFGLLLRGRFVGFGRKGYRGVALARCGRDGEPVARLRLLDAPAAGRNDVVGLRIAALADLHLRGVVAVVGRLDREGRGCLFTAGRRRLHVLVRGAARCQHRGGCQEREQQQGA